MRVQIDSQRCQGHGRCYSLAPDVYDCDDEGYGTVRVADLPDGLEGQA
ncbi:MAG: ferredoxin, partial [Acidimicrobiales bacterium]